MNTICLFMLFVSAQSSLFMNPLRKTFSTGTIKHEHAKGRNNWVGPLKVLAIEKECKIYFFQPLIPH